MVEPLVINRRKTTHSELSFDSLRTEAIGLIEQFSGKTWTDYNLHDPGITILEQLIYAITDLVYRTEFALQDYLVDEDGHLDLKACSLHAPAEIFPCRATTISDYRKLLLNAVPRVDNLWLSTTSGQSGPDRYRGIYRLLVKLEQGLDQQAQDLAIENLRATYHSARNLCEDLGEIDVVNNLDYELNARIEVSSAYYPADILAEIYANCARCMAGSVSITHYDGLDGDTRSLDQLFDGPNTDHGFFFDEDMQDYQSEFLVSKLISVINSIAGVDHIEELYLARGDKQYYDRVTAAGPNEAFDLLIPKLAEDVRVDLSINGRVLPIAIDEVIARVEDFKFKYHASRSTPQDLSLLYEPVTGVSRPLSRYSSIQNQFPVNYGINQFGVPETAAADVKARARQLKGYLLIFEQLMVNFLANLGSVKTLFSTRVEPRVSYALQPLKGPQINDLEAVYPQNPDEVLAPVIARFDDYNERKNRVLDYLLAIYGERFSQNSLHHFNYYYGKDELGDAIVANKIAYLDAIVELGRDRAAAPDYHAVPITGKQSGLGLRVSMLLEFEQRQARTTTTALAEQDFGLCPHDDYRQQKAGSDEYRLIASEEMGGSSRDSFEQPLLAVTDKSLSLQSLRNRLADIFPRKHNLLSDQLLRKGIYIDRYRVGPLKSSPDHQLIFLLDDGHYWHLASYADKPAAFQAANDLCRYLLLLNQHSEGLHIIEHIQLRPQRQAESSTADSARDDDFFSFRISAVFSCWTARCHNQQFRLLAEETIRLNAPAHVYPEIYWLDFAQMVEFEALYDHWLTLKYDRESEPDELDRSARAIIVFLGDQSKARQQNSGSAP